MQSNILKVISQVKSFQVQMNRAIKTGIEKESKSILKNAVMRFRPRPEKKAYPNTTGFLYTVTGTLKNSLLTASFGRNMGSSVFFTSFKDEITHLFGTSTNQKEFFYPQFHDARTKFSVLSDLVSGKRYLESIVRESHRIHI